MTSRGSARFVRARFERTTGEPTDTWAGLEKLVANQVPEGPELEYKLRAYDDPRTPPDERNDELRKDVTALANAVGGVIVCGISDTNGLPGKVLGVTGNLEQIEGHLGSVIRSRILPPLDGVEIQGVAHPGPGDGCVLMVVPASPRAPHAVQPHADADALKCARRVGRHTEWLSEIQVADLYRARFSAAVDQADRAQLLLTDLREALPRRGWLLVGLVPDSPGEFTVSRDRLDQAQRWWFGRRRLDLLPNNDTGPADASAGPRRIVLARSDGTTSVPTGVYAELHDDGACAMALELRDGPSGNLSFYLDDVVSQALDAITWVTDFSVSQAGAGGYGLLASALHFPESPGGQILCFDPSWSNDPKQLERGGREPHTEHTVDIEAIQSSSREVVVAAALVAGHLAQFFGLPDARYLTPTGTIRVNQYSPQARDRVIVPAASALGIPVDKEL